MSLRKYYERGPRACCRNDRLLRLEKQHIPMFGRWPDRKDRARPPGREILPPPKEPYPGVTDIQTRSSQRVRSPERHKMITPQVLSLSRVSLLLLSNTGKHRPFQRRMGAELLLTVSRIARHESLCSSLQAILHSR